MTTSHDLLDQTSYAYPANSVFIEELYARYLQNKSAVDAEWRLFFEALADSKDAVLSAKKGPSWAPRSAAVMGQEERIEAPKAAKSKGGTEAGGHISKEVMEAATRDSIRALMLIRAYRVRGHLQADLDPLKLEERPKNAELDPSYYGFAEEDYDRVILLDGSLGLKTASLREIMEILKATYCGTVGVEFMHIQFPEQKSWIQQRIESARGTPQMSDEERKAILDTLIEVESFEQFLQVKYAGTKRFSVQGGDAMVPGLAAAINRASDLGVEEVILGMPHRGRMNVLTTVMGKPYAELLSIFHGNLDFPEWVESSGDVKYHLGVSSDKTLSNGKKMHLSLAANPSHLEAVNPVVVGRVRAKLGQREDLSQKNTVMGVLMHGDAAFAGQGLVPETLSLSELRGYRTGGTLNIIVNNQIGFTTSPKYSRFTPYPSDVAKAVQAPIFHVNGDDPEAVAWVCKLAVEFRQEFKRDVVVDIFCFRKYGHNESDEPMFTQPLMYKAIAKHKLPAATYADRLIVQGKVTQDYVDAKFAEFKTFFEEQHALAQNFKPNKAQWLEGKWSGLERPKGEHPTVDTGVEETKLKEIGLALASYPNDFNINSKIARQLETKKKMMESGEGIDWGTAEALAFGSLLTEGFSVRLSGQDCGRGTFSHRHSVFIDQENENRHVPLNHLGGEQKEYTVYDSSLSEFAVLGFEYGYSTAEPTALTLWEAQFGDFANGAQVIVDQFISSAEAKWLRMSGLVMLLPHGYEGQGPEHSSARLERYLQMCGEDNMQIANCSTPANYFHILRRQLHRKFRKPLILMTPKSLLRHKLCVSTLKELSSGTHFQRVISETQTLVKDDKIRRIVLTSGKVYYDLFESRAAQNINDVAIVRLEQYYPFPARELKEELKRYKNAEVVWCQEEPENMGAWRFVGPRIGDILEELGRASLKIGYVGRKEAASTAAGYLKIHEAEQKSLVAQALALPETKKRLFG